jgi:signal transduction histidine kinase
MHEIVRPVGDRAAAVTAMPGRDPPTGRVADSAETSRRLLEDRNHIAAEINDVAVRRMFSAGLALDSALGLLDGHRAGERIQDAIAELDQAIIGLRGTVFGMCRTDSPDGDTSS